ncbi:hypothetical protein D3C75_1095230 [compost metagenome]
MAVSRLLLIYPRPLKKIKLISRDGIKALQGIFFNNGADDVQPVFLQFNKFEFAQLLWICTPNRFVSHRITSLRVKVPLSDIA